MEDEIEHVREARQAFDLQSAGLRPDLHRFCTRMMGSVSDGEDAVQDTLVHAFYHLPELRGGSSLRAWLFRIAHNLCIDLLRRRKAFVPLDDELSDVADDGLEQRQLASHALAAIFTQLPPKERAAIVLKDVLGYSLEETAEVTSSNVGAVKAAVHRARRKLELATHQPPSLSSQDRALIECYAERFNSRDWAGVRALLCPDARLEVVQRSEGPFQGRYFSNYAEITWAWRLALASVEGTPMLVHYRFSEGEWLPHSVIVISVRSGQVALVRDYVHVGYLLCGARVLAARAEPS